MDTPLLKRCPVEKSGCEGKWILQQRVFQALQMMSHSVRLQKKNPHNELNVTTAL